MTTTLLYKQVNYRAMHRGGKEADRLLGGFVAQYADSFAQADLEALNALLNHDDVDVFEWLDFPERSQFTPEPPVFARLRQHLNRARGYEI